jgi:pyridoxamine 5'-phosphate oxidase
MNRDPVKSFLKFYKAALQTEKDHDPTVVSLATSTKKGKPSLRYVLFKGVSKNRFGFVTNYSSQKGKELEENPRAALAFYWHKLYMQVRIVGHVEKFLLSESDKYWKQRPLASQLSGSISRQSRPLKSFEHLVKSFSSNLKKLNATGVSSISRPKDWGGYWLHPESIEFWFGKDHRLHHRICYKKQRSNRWTRSLLFP